VNASIYAEGNLNSYASGPIKGYFTGVKQTIVGMSINSQNDDFFDSKYATWLTGALQAQSILSGPHNDYVIGVTVDDADYTGGMRAGPPYNTVSNGSINSAPGRWDPHYGLVTLISSPLQSGAVASKVTYGGDQFYVDNVFHAKQEWQTWLQGTTDGGPGYASISALNAAWGSNYDSFGSDGVSHTETICALNCATTTYNYTLANTPSPLSVQVLVGGTVVAGDDGTGPTANPATNSGNFRGPTLNAGSSTINYSTKAITLVFNSAPNSAITVTYVSGGWGTGHGLLDEDGTCPSKSFTCWLPTSDFYQLSGSASAFQTDMSNFLYHWAKKYFSTVKSCLNTVWPGFLYMGPTSLGSWGTPPRKEILQGASSSVDLFGLGFPALVSDDQARINFTAQYGGDKPWFEGTGFDAQPDSYMSVYPVADVTPPHTSTQASRGTQFQTLLNEFLSANDSSYSSYHIVGYRWWDYHDERSESMNWGFVTPRDDPYDGISATTSQGYDSWGYPTGCLATFGCEQASYGDFIDSVEAANLNALRAIATGP
jgi:hypothetical protein